MSAHSSKNWVRDILSYLNPLDVIFRCETSNHTQIQQVSALSRMVWNDDPHKMSTSKANRNYSCQSRSHFKWFSGPDTERRKLSWLSNWFCRHCWKVCTYSYSAIAWNHKPRRRGVDLNTTQFKNATALHSKSLFDPHGTFLFRLLLIQFFVFKAATQLARQVQR